MKFDKIWTSSQADTGESCEVTNSPFEGVYIPESGELPWKFALDVSSEEIAGSATG